MNTENSDFGQTGKTFEDGREAFVQKLSVALQENKVLRDRLAELDISMHIETVELKKDIEALGRERDELTKENELLLEDYTAKDHKIQELLRQLEIKQLMINETGSYLSTATDRIKNLEKQCSNLEAQYAAIYGHTTAPEKIDEETLPDDGPGPRNALIRDIREEFEETLGQKDLEIETLHRNLERLKARNNILTEEKAEAEKNTTETPETSVPLENTLREMEHSLTGLEQRISRASEIGITEKEEILMKLDDAQREIFSLREYHRSLLEALRDRVEQDGRGNSCSTRELEEKLDNAEKKNSHLEAELDREGIIRVDLEDLIQRKDMILQELHEQFLSDTEKLRAETAGAKEAAERAEDEIKRLETMASRSKAEIAALNEQIAEQQIFGETKSRETAELTEKSSRIEEDLRRLSKTSEVETAAFQNIINLRDRELEALTCRKEELETELRNAAGALAQQKDLLALAEKAPLQQEEINSLRRDNEALSARLAEALQRTATLEDIKAAISLEIKRLSEKMELLTDERMTDRITLKNDIDKSFSMISESTERLEHAIAEGLPLVRRLEEISSGMLREDLPAVYTAVPQRSEKNRRSTRGRQLVVAVGLLLLFVLTAAIFFRQDVYHALSENGLFAAAPKAAPWETGTKQAKSGQYETTLTFLNKEAVQVLGFSDIIPDSGLTHNTFALVEIRSVGGCIPEDFIVSPEKYVSFLDNRGAATPLNDPGALSGWKKTIYKQNACGDKKAGAVYMKHIISAVKSPLIRGLAVRGLAMDPIILQ